MGDAIQYRGNIRSVSGRPVECVAVSRVHFLTSLSWRALTGDCRGDSLLGNARVVDSVADPAHVHKHLFHMALRPLRTDCSRTLQIY